MTAKVELFMYQQSLKMCPHSYLHIFDKMIHYSDVGGDSLDRRETINLQSLNDFFYSQETTHRVHYKTSWG